MDFLTIKALKDETTLRTDLDIRLYIIAELKAIKEELIKLNAK